MLGRYRTQRTSMISMSNLAADAMRAHLVERYPTPPLARLTQAGVRKRAPRRLARRRS